MNGRIATLIVTTLALLFGASSALAGPGGRWNLLVMRAEFSDAPGQQFSDTDFVTQWVPQIESYFENVSNGQLDLFVTIGPSPVRLQERKLYHACPPTTTTDPEDPYYVEDGRPVDEGGDCRFFGDDAVKAAVTTGFIIDAEEGLRPPGGGPEDVFDGILVVFTSPLDYPLDIWKPCNAGKNAWAAGGDVQIEKGDGAGEYYAGTYAVGVAMEDGDLSCDGNFLIPDVGGAIHEVGHFIAWHRPYTEGTSRGSHPSDYKNPFELMDSCYPCEMGAYTRVGSAIKGEIDGSPIFRDWFEGWLPDWKVRLFDPATTPDPEIVTLAPIGQASGSTGLPQAVRLNTKCPTKIFMLECRARLDWDAADKGNIPSEGLLIYDAHMGRRPEVDIRTPPLGATWRTNPGGLGNLWTYGKSFDPPGEGITVSVFWEPPPNCRFMIEYGPESTTPSPDVMLQPWYQPPRNEPETVDIWLDSECNGYDTYRYTDGTGQPTGNGDDLCANQVNRVYARVRNVGTEPARDVVVRFERTDPLGVGIRGAAGWQPIGVANRFSFPELAEIAPDGEAVVYVEWTPELDRPDLPVGEPFRWHSCVRVTIDPVGGECVLDNQDGEGEQENIDYGEAITDSPPEADFPIYAPVDRELFLVNDSNDRKRYYLNVVSDLPEGWQLDVAGGQLEFELDGGEERRLPVRVTPPDGAPVGQGYFAKVEAYEEEEHTDGLGGTHEGSHFVAGVLVATRTVHRTTMTLNAVSDPPDSCFPDKLVTDGCLSVPVNGATLMVSYRGPGGTRVTQPTVTGPDGCFHDELPFPEGGTWSVRAFWHGTMEESSVHGGPVEVEAFTPGDRDCDQQPDGQDNCPDVANPDQLDGDGDGFGDLCDCAPADAGAWEIPAQTANVGFLADKTTLFWDSARPQAGDATVHDLFRGSLGELPVGSNPAGDCLVGNVSADTYEDSVMPPLPGEGFWYLVRGSNACGDGGLGAPSGGAPRTPGSCSDCLHDKCSTGFELAAECDPCVQQICAVDSFCCEESWDSVCVEEVRTVCGSLVCDESRGNCPHTLCSIGPALTPECDVPPANPSCVTQICNADAFCCDEWWDDICVSEVETVCGNNCY